MFGSGTGTFTGALRARDLRVSRTFQKGGGHDGRFIREIEEGRSSRVTPGFGFSARPLDPDGPEIFDDRRIGSGPSVDKEHKVVLKKTTGGRSNGKQMADGRGK